MSGVRTVEQKRRAALRARKWQITNRTRWNAYQLAYSKAHPERRAKYLAAHKPQTAACQRAYYYRVTKPKRQARKSVLMATLTLRGAAKMISDRRVAVANWLHVEADNLIHDSIDAAYCAAIDAVEKEKPWPTRNATTE